MAVNYIHNINISHIPKIKKTFYFFFKLRDTTYIIIHNYIGDTIPLVEVEEFIFIWGIILRCSLKGGTTT